MTISNTSELITIDLDDIRLGFEALEHITEIPHSFSDDGTCEYCGYDGVHSILPNWIDSDGQQVDISFESIDFLLDAEGYTESSTTKPHQHYCMMKLH